MSFCINKYKHPNGFNIPNKEIYLYSLIYRAFICKLDYLPHIKNIFTPLASLSISSPSPFISSPSWVRAVPSNACPLT